MSKLEYLVVIILILAVLAICLWSLHIMGSWG